MTSNLKSRSVVQYTDYKIVAFIWHVKYISNDQAKKTGFHPCLEYSTPIYEFKEVEES